MAEMLERVPAESHVPDYYRSLSVVCVEWLNMLPRIYV